MPPFDHLTNQLISLFDLLAFQRPGAARAILATPKVNHSLIRSSNTGMTRCYRELIATGLQFLQQCSDSAVLLCLLFMSNRREETIQIPTTLPAEASSGWYENRSSSIQIHLGLAVNQSSFSIARITTSSYLPHFLIL